MARKVHVFSEYLTHVLGEVVALLVNCDVTKPVGSLNPSSARIIQELYSALTCPLGEMCCKAGLIRAWWISKSVARWCY